ncbi:hypothetical protein AVEN_136725-1 [Araneus ventricosus]|uniref:Uncharacterized protein n=1 Tax=Araneus ventricosus TaxID=182803 RepID=A0A4Y2EW87_ARAVE|nr:hypothetical protein AVEN_136725-1 [Araneus ventricosus]
MEEDAMKYEMDANSSLQHSLPSRTQVSFFCRKDPPVEAGRLLPPIDSMVPAAPIPSPRHSSNILFHRPGTCNDPAENKASRTLLIKAQELLGRLQLNMARFTVTTSMINQLDVRLKIAFMQIRHAARSEWDDYLMDKYLKIRDNNNPKMVHRIAWSKQPDVGV